MKARWLLVAGLGFVFALPGAPSWAAPGAAAASANPPQPFTAEQIRDEWVEGLSLVLRRVTPEGETRERWTVVSADPEGAVIEFTALDAKGQASGESRRQRSSWSELRDHAKFPAGATRKELTRETALGKFDGWLYSVPDAAQGTVTEFFFARTLPGAPLEMKVMRDGRTLMEMTQVSRSNR